MCFKPCTETWWPNAPDRNLQTEISNRLYRNIWTCRCFQAAREAACASPSKTINLQQALNSACHSENVEEVECVSLKSSLRLHHRLAVLRSAESRTLSENFWLLHLFDASDRCCSYPHHRGASKTNAVALSVCSFWELEKIAHISWKTFITELITFKLETQEFHSELSKNNKHLKWNMWNFNVGCVG